MFTQIFLFHFMVKTFQNPFLPLFERCFVRLGAYSHPDVRDTPITCLMSTVPIASSWVRSLH